MGPLALTSRGFAALAFSTVLALPFAASGQDASALRQKAASMHDRFANNPFGRPLALESTQTSSSLKSDVYTIVEHPYATVEHSLKSIDNWCDILILHLNVKRCKGVQGDAKVALDVGRKFDQPIEEAYRLMFDYRLAASTADYLQVVLSAPEGPFGTNNYRIQVEAAPLDPKRTLIHMSYAYGYGFTAKLAIQTYLATVGRDKVGFTVTGTGADGKPAYVGGIVGLLERNTMRYYLAIDAFLSAVSAPAADQPERRIRNWYANTERYSVQLHEMERAEYLEMKRKEIARQQAG